MASWPPSSEARPNGAVNHVSNLGEERGSETRSRQKYLHGIIGLETIPAARGLIQILHLPMPWFLSCYGSIEDALRSWPRWRPRPCVLLQPSLSSADIYVLPDFVSLPQVKRLGPWWPGPSYGCSCPSSPSTGPSIAAFSRFWRLAFSSGYILPVSTASLPFFLHSTPSCHEAGLLHHDFLSTLALRIMP